MASSESAPAALCSLTFEEDSPAAILSALRTQPSLAWLRILRITLTETQALAWHGKLYPGARAAYDDDNMEQFARRHSWASVHGPWPNAAAEWHELLQFLASHPNLDLADLRIEIDLGRAMWEVFDTNMPLAYDDDYDKTYRFLYDWAVEVAEAMCATLGGKVAPGSVAIDTAVWQGLGPWLEREVTGRLRDRLTEEEVARRLARPSRDAPQELLLAHWRREAPEYHDGDRRLAGSR